MPRTARVIQGVKPDNIPYDELFAGNEPTILRGLVSGWTLVEAGKKSADEVMDMLLQHYNGKPIIVYEGDPEIKGRFAYDSNYTGFNYRSVKRDLREVFRDIRATFGQKEHPYYYMNSMMVDDSFPGLRNGNDLVFNHPVFAEYPHIAKIWVGNQSQASAHYDIPKNIACCVLGKRRFTLFPPEQVHNLYPGPLSPTPGGQVITVTDLNNPDFDQFPRLRAALSEAIIVDMEPGDALYYPSLWWHEVSALDTFNVMINFWWMDSPRFMGDPNDALMHAMMRLRERPNADKQAWRALFDYYVFGDAEKPRAHLPDAAQGALGKMDETLSRRLRAMIQNSLNH